MGFTPLNYSQFEGDLALGPYFGPLYLICFVAITMVLYFGIFVSILIVMYTIYEKQINTYQLIEALKVRPVTQADKEYSSLISLPPPLNGILFFLGPFLMTSRNPEIINRVVLWVAYLPILICSFVIFALYSFALVPLTYMKMFFHKMIMIFVYSKSHRVSRADKFMLWIFFGIIGPFRLFRNAVVDCIAYLHHCSL
jgi:hypothetical protein